jgi:hypothetical protein
MSISKTSLINKSLTMVGAAPITSIDDDTNNARIVNRVYEISLKSILSECLWNFACVRALLTVSSDTMAWSYSGENYVYTRPTACVRIFGTNDDDAVWREEGDHIISDTSGLGIKYTYYHDDPSKYPASFVEAFCDKLAADAAYMILNSKDKAQAMQEKYESVSLPKDRSENAQIGTQQYVKDDYWESCKTSDGRANLSYD